MDRVTGDRRDRDRLLAGEPPPAPLIAIHACGAAAVDVFRAAIVASLGDAERGVATDGGGLYLMTRALMDVRFDAIVRDAGVPLGSVLAGLAAVWCGQRGVFDPAVACWCAGDESPGSLDAHIPALHTIEARLRERLTAQKALEDGAEIQDVVRDTEESADPAWRVVERIADLLMRAWQRWLPGLSASSPSYVVANCLTRRAHVRIDDYEIRVQLESAPFDVVLEMAGYLRPIEQVAWLGRRRISFELIRMPTA